MNDQRKPLDYAGNSHKAKEKAEQAQEEPTPKKELSKVIAGDVVEKKPGPMHRVRSIFFGGEFKDVMSYVFWDKMVPGARDMAFDLVKDGAHRMFYGSAPRRDPRGPRVNYGGMYDRPARRLGPPPSTRLPDQPPRGLRQNRRESNDIVLASRDDAQSVLDTMIECVDKYEVVSLADLYELVGLPQSHVDQKWGWTYLSSANIRQIRDGYLLELPPMEEI